MQYLGWVAEIVPMRSARLSLDCIPTLLDLIVRPPAPPRPRLYPPAAGDASLSSSSLVSSTPTLNTCSTSAFTPQHFEQGKIKILVDVGRWDRATGCQDKTRLISNVENVLHPIAQGCVFPRPPAKAVGVTATTIKSLRPPRLLQTGHIKS